jgi:hypothetical protein
LGAAETGSLLVQRRSAEKEYGAPASRDGAKM